MKKLQITMTPKQARIIKVALEEYFRAPLGQWHDLASRLAYRGFNWDDHTNEEFCKRIVKKEHALYAFAAAGNIVMDRTGTIPRPDDEQIASDMWRILLWELMPESLKRGTPRDTYHENDEPPIKVEEVSE